MVARGRRLRREAWGFAIGSLCFAAGAVPHYAAWAGAVGTSATFFIGALFFTAAGFVQLSLSGRRPPRGDTEAADRADWWAAFVQFIGTIFFNVSTTQVLVASLADSGDASAGWRPDAFGSIAFLVSSGFAIAATRDRGRLWDTDARTWHGTWLNVVGAIAFAASAVGAFVLPATDTLLSAAAANSGTFVGAACFFTAAVMSRRGAPAVAS